MEPELKTILETMQGQLTTMQGQMQSMHEEMNRRFEAVDRRFEGVDQRFESIDRRFDKMERENAAAHAETRRHIEVVLEAFVKPKFEVLVETIQILDESLSERIRVLEARP